MMDAVAMLRVLGPLEVDPAPAADRPGDRSAVPPRLRRLLAALSIHGSSVATVDGLATALWGDDPPANTDAALHNLVSRLRRLLADHGAADWLTTAAPGYRLTIGVDDCDALLFEHLTDRSAGLLATAPADAAATLDRALGLWRGSAYAEFADEEFARARASELSHRRTTAVELRAEAALILGDHEGAAAVAGALTASEPYRERPIRQLMLAHHRSGSQAGALAAYDDFRRRLADELGLDPSPELQALQASVLAADPALDWRAAAPPAPPVHPMPDAQDVSSKDDGGARAPRHHPTGSTLVGRDQDVAAIVGHLGGVRVVTLTGPGGVGKTTLASAVAAASGAQERFADGVWWCELAALGPADEIADALTTTMGLQTRHDGDATARLVDALGGRRVLIVLDNCEHLVEAAAVLVDAIANRCPHAVVLATSREPLNVEGELPWPVEPLALPEVGADGVAVVAASPAVALLVARAQVAAPGFVLDDTNAAAIAEITRRLDGLPLALELAAIRMRVIGPHDLATRLTWRFRLLRQGVRTAPGRHQTLEAVVRWSYELLDDAEQRVLELVSAFAGSFTLETAEALVVGATTGERTWDRGEVAGLVLSLADRSMVVAIADGDGDGRWRLLETIRAYGRGRLGERPYADKVPDLHAEILAEISARTHGDLFGPGHTAATTLIELEFDDLRAAATWATDHHLDEAVTLVGGLLCYCEHRMPVEPLGWAERVIAAADAAGRHPDGMDRVFAVAAACARFVDELDYADALITRGLQVEATDPQTTAQLLYLRCEVALFLGRVDEAGSHLEQFTAAASAGGPGLVLMAALMDVLRVAYLGETERSVAMSEQLAGSAAALGPAHPVAAWATYVRGEVLVDHDPARAAALLDEALERALEVGDRYLTGVTYVSAASTRARHGDPREAATLYVSAIDHWFAASDWTHQWTTVRNIVDLLVRLDAYSSAAVILAALDTRRTTAAGFGSELERLDAARRALPDRLSADEGAALARQGAAMSDEEVLAFVTASLRGLADVAIDLSAGTGRTGRS